MLGAAIELDLVEGAVMFALYVLLVFAAFMAGVQRARRERRGLRLALRRHSELLAEWKRDAEAHTHPNLAGRQPKGGIELWWDDGYRAGRSDSIEELRAVRAEVLLVTVTTENAEAATRRKV